MQVKVAFIQMNSKTYDLNGNLKLAMRLALDGVHSGAKLVVLPELFDSGYCVSNQDKSFGIDLEDKHNKTIKALSKFAKKHRIYMIACSIEKNKGRLFDTAYIISKKGKILGKQRKIFLWNTEKQRFSNGGKQQVFSLDIKGFKLKVGIAICYEIGFAEISRNLALDGAQVIIYPSAFGKARSYAWDLLSRARALENGLFVIACNRSGNEFDEKFNQKLEFAGLSRAISPKGEIIAQAQKENECVMSVIDIGQIQEQREAIPYLADLRKFNKKGKIWQKKF